MFPKGFDHLLARPFRGGMFGDTEMEYLVRAGAPGSERRTALATGSWESEEVDGHNLAKVIAQECLPCLRWVAVAPPERCARLRSEMSMPSFRNS